jgi:hypothetical protein
MGGVSGERRLKWRLPPSGFVTNYCSVPVLGSVLTSLLTTSRHASNNHLHISMPLSRRRYAKHTFVSLLVGKTVYSTSGATLRASSGGLASPALRILIRIVCKGSGHLLASRWLLRRHRNGKPASHVRRPKQNALLLVIGLTSVTDVKDSRENAYLTRR